MALQVKLYKKKNNVGKDLDARLGIEVEFIYYFHVKKGILP